MIDILLLIVKNGKGNLMDVVRDIKIDEKGDSPRTLCSRPEGRSYGWMDNLDVQRLLDVVSSIIADEYIEVAKRNKDVFGAGK